MQKILFGTRNKAKLEMMKKMISPLGIEIIGLSDLDSEFPTVNENGNSPAENAKIKALEYFKVAKIPTFSCDMGLFIDGVPNELQPGVHVRNVKGKCLTDEEMIEYYSLLSKNYGGNVIAQYKNAICLVLSETEIYEYMGDDISGNRFIICDKPHHNRVEGFPIGSLSIDIESGKYYHDLEEIHVSSNEVGFQKFFQKYFISQIIYSV